MSVEDVIPAPCQGTVALELREDNTDLLNKLNSLSDDTIRATKAEREFLRSVGGNCHLRPRNVSLFLLEKRIIIM